MITTNHKKDVNFYESFTDLTAMAILHKVSMLIKKNYQLKFDSIGSLSCVILNYSPWCNHNKKNQIIIQINFHLPMNSRINKLINHQTINKTQ